MNTQQIKQIENCFNPNHVCDLSNLSVPTVEEVQEFMDLMENYKMEAHVIRFWFLQNSGAFDSDIPF